LQRTCCSGRRPVTNDDVNAVITDDDFLADWTSALAGRRCPNDVRGNNRRDEDDVVIANVVTIIIHHLNNAMTMFVHCGQSDAYGFV